MSLDVTCDFPGGNAALIRTEVRDNYDLVQFHASPHGGPEALWFQFELSGADPSRTTRIELQNTPNLLGGGDGTRLRPVVRIGDGDWQRLPGGTGEHDTSGLHSVYWELNGADHYRIAFCFPYHHENLRPLLESGYWTESVVGCSQGGRPLYRLSNHADPDGSAERPGLFLMTRQHSGETPGSWVMHGMLEYFESVQSEICVWAVLLSNIDGIEQGDYGKDNFPYDLNRAWSTPKMRHETHVFSADFNRWAKRCDAKLALDLHSPGASEDDGVYAFIPDPEQLPERHEEVLDWCKVMSKELGEFTADRLGRVAHYPSRWTTANFAEFACETVPAMSYEIPYGAIKGNALEVSDYLEIGARIARAVGKGVHSIH
jgi:hypothetical protein